MVLYSIKIDVKLYNKYFAHLAIIGLSGLVVLGTNTETYLLSREERKAFLRCARSGLPAGHPVIAGVSGHSTSQVLEYIEDAYETGSDYVLLLPCAYFGKQTTPAVIKEFYSQVASVSPLPIIIYNFPAVCSGVDLDSEIIADIAQEHENVVGVKLTCGSVAKIARLAATFPPSRFAVFGGQSDFLMGGLAVGSSGCIAAFGNIFPRSVARLYNLWRSGKHDEALELQRMLSLAESCTKAGIANTKYATAIMTASRAGIENAASLLRPRRPYEEPTETVKAEIRKAMEKVRDLEDIETLVRESRL